MHTTVPILLQHQGQRPHDWIRFVSILCAFEAYVVFVAAGTVIWAKDLGVGGKPLWLFVAHGWTSIPMFILALLLYVAAAGLWRDDRRSRGWLGLALVCVTSMLGCEMIAAVRQLTELDPLGVTITALGVACVSSRFGLLCLLGTAMWISRPRRRAVQLLTADWALCAASLCFAMVIFESLGAGVAGSIGNVLSSSGNILRGYLAYAVVILLLLATAFGLLYGWRAARTTALILVALAAVSIWYDWYPIAMLVQIAIQALLMSHGGIENYDVTIWTRWDFIWLFVQPAQSVGPWLLIAIYAWKKPLRVLPDDGSPWPRYFCGGCHYNVMGPDIARCPECGAALTPP